MARTRIKICGISRPEDAEDAVAAGVDALGFNFFPRSARYVTPERAMEIVSCLPAFVTTVGLFVNEPEHEVRRILQIVPVDLLQFHGEESVQYCEAFDRPYIKAIPATGREDIKAKAVSFGTARGLLIDSSVAGQFGGTGVTFDWQLIPDLAKPLILAGGLDAQNVGQAIAALHPYCVDVSGGVEIEKGKKNRTLINEFVEAVRLADQEFP